jgi:23S rRNA (cytosine1962-C5)-methyltransferase
MIYPILKLQKGADQRLRTGHLWIFANEFHGKLSQSGINPGQLICVQTQSGEPIGIAAFNPNSLIAARILERDSRRQIDVNWLASKLTQAASLRRSMGRELHTRLVHGEGDALPGLVIDRFDQLLVAQLNLAFWDQQRQVLIDAVRIALPDIKAMMFKNDSSARASEGLQDEVVMAFGEEPPHILVSEAGIQFSAALRDGQKTAWFYDQRDNRDQVFHLLAPVIKGAKVLDLFCYLGGWGLRALQLGAAQSVCVDASAGALTHLQTSADAHGWKNLVTVQSDVFDALKDLKQQAQRFDLVVVDPPAFVKRKRDLEEGALAYRRVFEAALRVCADQAFIVLTSCSHHYSKELLIDGLARAAARCGMDVQMIADLRQAADHPVHPSMPETAYLKGVLARVVRTAHVK